MGELLPFPRSPFHRPVASPVRQGLLVALEHIQGQPQNIGCDLVSEADRFPDDRSLARYVGAEVSLLPVPEQSRIRLALADFMTRHAERCMTMAAIAAEIGKDALDALPSALAAVCVVTFVGFICIAMGGA